jgi:hypothetical protein
MAKKSAVARIVDRLPDPDERGLLSNIDKDVVDGVVAELLEGGRRSINGLINMLVEPGAGDDMKAHYALHCLAVHVCRGDNDRPRRMIAKTLAAKLGGDQPKGVQKYLIRQLQVCGGSEVAPKLGDMLLDEELCEPAAQALSAIGSGAGAELRKALPKVTGKSRLTIVQNLGVVRDDDATEALQEELNDEDRDVRLAAAWGLANIGDAGSVDLLLNAAGAASGYERIKATKACLLLAERLAAAGKAGPAAKTYRRLRDTRKGGDEAYVREAAEAGLAKIR